MSGPTIAALNAFIANPYQAEVNDLDGDGRLEVDLRNEPTFDPEIAPIVDAALLDKFGFINDGIIRAIESYVLPGQSLINSDDFDINGPTIPETYESLYALFEEAVDKLPNFDIDDIRLLDPTTPDAPAWTSSQMLKDLPGGGFDIDATIGTPGNKPVAILGSEFADEIKGAKNSSIVDAGAGDDEVFASKAGGKEAFWLLGEGDDFFRSKEGINIAWGGLGDDTFLNDYWGGTTFDGGAGDDLLQINSSGRGNSKQAIMVGGEGDDTVTGGALTINSIFTGSGDDVLDIEGKSFVDMGVGDDFLETNGRTVVLAGEGNDTMTVVGKPNPVCFAGEEGDDVIQGGLGGGYLFGGVGDDTITGAKFSETLAGGDGEDVIYGANGQDIIVLEPGQSNIDRVVELGGDKFDVSSFGITSFEQLQAQITAGSLAKLPADAEYDFEFTITNLNGSVTVQIIDGPSTIGDGRFLYADEAFTIPEGAEIGTGGDDILSFGNTADLIYSGAGDDSVAAGRGDDTIYGGGGDDTILAERGDDLVYAEAGDDLVNGGRQNDTIYGGDGDDTLSGGKERDALYGDAGDDLLNGNNNNDTLTGGAGDDTLIGGSGLDTLIGGDGADTFVFTFLNNKDTLLDFNGAEGDRLDFSQIASAAVTEDNLADYLMIVESGDDITVRISPTGGNYTFKNVVRLEEPVDFSIEYILI